MQTEHYDAMYAGMSAEALCSERNLIEAKLSVPVQQADSPHYLDLAQRADLKCRLGSIEVVLGDREYVATGADCAICGGTGSIGGGFGCRCLAVQEDAYLAYQAEQGDYYVLAQVDALERQQCQPAW
jgi:hypothetical protein